MVFPSTGVPPTAGLAVDQAGLSEAARDFHAAADTITALTASVKDALHAASMMPDLPNGSAAWGDDHAGRAFADGAAQSPGYRASAQAVLDALSAAADAVHGVGDALTWTERVVEGADADAADTLARTGR